MKNIYTGCLLTVFLLLPKICFAFDHIEPYQLSLINPIQLVHERKSVSGFRWNIVYGVNNNISGLDVGMFNVAEGAQKGLQVGLYNSSFKSSGVQIGIVNRTEYLHGIQIGLINIHGEGNWRILPAVNFSF